MDKTEFCRIIKTNQKRDTLLCSSLDCRDCPVKPDCWARGGNANDLLAEWLQKNDITIKLELI